MDNKGAITKEAVLKLESAIELDGNNAPVIEVTSAGGDALAGIDLGNFLHSKMATIIVKEYCVSACAQFLFVGAPNRIVSPQSLVLFHGSPTLLFEEYSASEENGAAKLFVMGAKKESQLYKRSGVRVPFSDLPKSDFNRFVLNWTTAKRPQMTAATPSLQVRQLQRR